MWDEEDDPEAAEDFFAADDADSSFHFADEPPQEQAGLCGHAAVVLAALRSEHQSGRLAHALLLCGPEGIGKATLAVRFAEYLLGTDAAALARLHAGSHADFLRIGRAFDEKKEEFAREISVEQTRKIAEFLSLTPGEGQWRVVLIDDADSMNINAANAILKILEEPPPQTVILLVAHQAGRLLPTIRSRCRTFKVQPLSQDDYLKAARPLLPLLSREELLMLGEISDFSPGLAMALHEQGALDMLSELRIAFDELPQLSQTRVLGFADQITAGKQHQNWQLFTRIALYLIAQRARAGQPKWAEKWQHVCAQHHLVEARHLDYKSAVISFFHELPKVA